MTYDLIIIGGGPAGITAGIYAARQGMKTLLLTKEFGGQITNKTVHVENYPGFKRISGQDLIQKLKEHLEENPVNVREDTVMKINRINEGFTILTKNQEQFETKALIIASGSESKTLNIPGEKEYIGKGVSYCTVCDGSFFKGKVVAVIGGGNAGFEAALFLVNIAKKIYILEYSQVVKADQSNQKKVKKTGKVEIITSASLKEIKGEKFVNSIIYKDLKSQENKNLKVEGVFIEIGYRPAAYFVNDLAEHNSLINELGELRIDPKTCETKIPGLFAAGDVSDIEYKQIIIAAGEGAKATLSAYKYLKNLKT